MYMYFIHVYICRHVLTRTRLCFDVHTFSLTHGNYSPASCQFTNSIVVPTMGCIISSSNHVN